jgi:NAD(P)-dependent dehydrogenase (short-subunit alcohol dehydrogenase family)
MNPRVIVVTGANGGLGQAIALAFLGESPENVICLCVSRHRDHAQSLMVEYPDRCRIVQLDATQRTMDLGAE